MDIHKCIKVSAATDMPGQVIQLGDLSNLNQIFKVSDGEHLEFEIRVYETIKKAPEEPTDCKDSINIPEKFSNEKTTLIGMLSSFVSMWYETLGTIKVAQNRIEPEPGSKPIHQKSYLAGPAER